MPNFIDLTGQRFGRLVVIERAENIIYNDGRTRVQWLCQCDCHGPNSLVIVSSDHLRSGHTKSCGCLNDGHPKHNAARTTLYRKWASMLQRCYNPNSQAYENYGGRGITVCDEWHNYINFQNWVNETREDATLTLERINVDGNYCPENCTWATRKEQANNRRNTLIYELNGEKYTLNELCEIYNMPYEAVRRRVRNYGYDINTALTTPLRHHEYNNYEYYDYYEDPHDYDGPDCNYYMY